MSNFIIVPRTIFDKGTFGKDEPFTKREAFLDLVQMAAFEETDFYVAGYKYHVGRGQLAVSKSFLVKRWGWSIDKVRRYLDYLQRNGWCDCRCDHQCHQPITLISISCYDNYQGNDTTGDTIDATTPATRGDTTGDTQDNKNKKNNNNNTSSYAEAVNRIYALYPSTTKRPEGNTIALKSSKKNKAKIERMLSSGEYTEESLAYAITRYLDESKPEYLKLFETFLNQVPDYGGDQPSPGATAGQQLGPDGPKRKTLSDCKTRNEALEWARNLTKEDKEHIYETSFKHLHPVKPGEDRKHYWDRVMPLWEQELAAFVERRLIAVNNRF